MFTDNQSEPFSILDWGITPWTVLLLCAAPLLLLVLLQRIYPSKRAAWLSVIPFVLSLLVPWSWSPAWMWLIPTFAAALLMAVAMIDLLLLPAIQEVHVSRKMQKVGSLGNHHEIQIQVDNLSAVPIHAMIRDDTTAEGMSLTPEVHEVKLEPHKRTIVDFKLTPNRRGAFLLQFVYVQFISKLGFWVRLNKVACENLLHVYPNIKQIGEYSLLARTNRLSQIGVRRTRKVGQDSDFERLRDYTQDDNYRHIDWRSTGRRQKLTVRQYQTDQSQRVIFMLDCGRMMTNEYRGLSLLDYALNSILMLSYVALQQGDSVGMICFSDRIKTFVPPSGGKRQMNRILHGGFNQFPSLVQSRYDEAFLYLSTHCRRRSLVVLLTNVIDQVNADQIHSYMGNLIGCHLPLVVMLRDHRIFDAADHPAPDPAVLYRSAAASHLLVWRHQVLQRLKATGALTLDLFPEEMTARMVNQYLEIKARHML
jgi:uncharacterized protein (DUF58 family)